MDFFLYPSEWKHSFMWERRSLNLPSLAWMDKPEGAIKWSNSNPLPGMGKLSYKAFLRTGLFYLVGTSK